MAKTPNYYKVHTDGDEVALEPIYEELVPVVRGRWERKSWWQHKNRYEMDKCSVCCHQVKPKDAHNYCPNCGAKMDLEG